MTVREKCQYFRFDYPFIPWDFPIKTHGNTI